MRIINTVQAKAETNARNSLVSGYEIFLLCGAAFLLAFAYPLKQKPVGQSLPVNFPAGDAPVHLEASNDVPAVSDPVSTTVLLERT